MEIVLKVENLNVKLSNGLEIIKDVSFSIKRGEVVAIVGENGCGKSTILKAIMREDETNKKISGNISYCGSENILKMNANELQNFRSSVAYVSQKDEYNLIGKKMTVLDVMMDSAKFYNKSLTKDDIVKLFDKYQLRISDQNKSLFNEKSYPAKLSGGQQRLLSIISQVAVRENAKLFIIDEPLNNLDFKNAKRISNLITKIHKENPNAAILMVTHCRIFPIITRLISLKNGIIIQNNEIYHCYNCFGTANKDGYYDV